MTFLAEGSSHSSLASSQLKPPGAVQVKVIGEPDPSVRSWISFPPEGVMLRLAAVAAIEM